MDWLIPLAIVVLTGFVLWFRERRKSPRYLAVCEYWAYLPGTKMPPQDLIMDRMLNRNPHNRKGIAWIGAKEGILFSDVRLRVSLALREKNPQMFRPDLVEGSAHPTKEFLEFLASSQSVARVRYVSEERLKDRRHLTFLPHLVDSIADLGQSPMIYDCVSGCFASSSEFSRLLEDDPVRFDLHVSILWQVSNDDYYAETMGLQKIGCPELRSDFSTGDQRSLVMTLMESAAMHVWTSGEVPSSLDVDVFDSPFRLIFRQIRTEKFARVSMLRKLS